MEPRMNHPVAVVPGAMEALQALSKAATKSGVPFATLKMVEFARQPDQRLQLLRRHAHS